MPGLKKPRRGAVPVNGRSRGFQAKRRANDRRWEGDRHPSLRQASLLLRNRTRRQTKHRAVLGGLVRQH